MFPSKKIKKEPIETPKKIENKEPQSIEKIIEEVSLLEEPEVIDPNETPKEKRERKKRAVDKLRKERERKIKDSLSSLLSSATSNDKITTRNYSEYTD